MSLKILLLLNYSIAILVGNKVLYFLIFIFFIYGFIISLFITLILEDDVVLVVLEHFK